MSICLLSAMVKTAGKRKKMKGYEDVDHPGGVFFLFLSMASNPLTT